jgi:hypothetical protein
MFWVLLKTESIRHFNVGSSSRHQPPPCSYPLPPPLPPHTHARAHTQPFFGGNWGGRGVCGWGSINPTGGRKTLLEAVFGLWEVPVNKKRQHYFFAPILILRSFHNKYIQLTISTHCGDEKQPKNYINKINKINQWIVTFSFVKWVWDGSLLLTSILR